MRKKIFLGLLASTLILFATAANAIPQHVQSWLLAQGYQAIPLVHLKKMNQLLVNVSVGGGAKTFLLDNGTIQTLIFPGSGGSFILNKKAQRLRVNGGGGKHVFYREVRVPRMQFDGFITQNEIAYVPEYYFSELKKVNYAGIIGCDFLRAHSALIDVDGQMLYLRSRNTKSRSAFSSYLSAALKQSHYEKITLTETLSRHQVLQTGINGQPSIRFILDTGSANSFLSLRYARQHDFQLQPIGYVDGSAGGKVQIYQTYDVKSIITGEIGVKPQHMWVISYKYITAGRLPLSGTIGLDWMLLTHAFIDMANNTLYARA